MTLTTRKRNRLLVSAVIALIALYFILKAITVPEGTDTSLVIGGALTGLFAAGHACYMMGWRRAAAFLGISLSMSYLAEAISVATCSVTCYEYSAVLGPRLGHVPLAIPLSWFSMIYASYVIVNLAAEGQPISTKGKNAWVICLSVVTAFVMTAWDLTLDPYMVDLVGAWSWAEGGLAPRFFGIPMANYVGWVQTVFMIMMVYRFTERNLPLEPMGKISPLLASVPVTMYAVNGLSGIFVGFPEATRVLPMFTMGISIVVASVRLMQMQPIGIPVSLAQYTRKPAAPITDHLEPEFAAVPTAIAMPVPHLMSEASHD